MYAAAAEAVGKWESRGVGRISNSGTSGDRRDTRTRPIRGSSQATNRALKSIEGRIVWCLEVVKTEVRDNMCSSPEIGVPPCTEMPDVLLLKAIRAGQDADFSNAKDDLSRMLSGSAVVEACCLDLPAAANIRITGARIGGAVSLATRELTLPIEFTRCEFDSAIDLSDARAKSMRFSGCKLVTLTAKHAVFNGAVEFRDGTDSSGIIDFDDAHVQARFHFERTHVDSKRGVALSGNRLQVDQELQFGKDTILRGGVILQDSVIRGGIVLSGCIFELPNFVALDASRARIGSRVYIGNGFRCDGQLNFAQTDISGSIEIEDASFENAPAVAVRLNGMQLKGALIIKKHVHCKGEFAIRYASIGATVEADGAVFDNPNGTALSLVRTNISGQLRFGSALRCNGESSFLETRVGTSIEFDNVQLGNYRGVALRADGLTTGVSFRLLNSKVWGVFRLAAARIGSNLAFQNTEISNVAGIAIEGYGLVTSGEIRFSPGFKSVGEVRIANAQIGGNLELDGASLMNPYGVAIRADGMSVKGAIHFANDTAIQGNIRLNSANVGAALEISQCKLENSSGDCLNAYESKIGSITFGAGFRAVGRIGLIKTRVTGGLTATGCSISAAGRTALDAEGIVVGQAVTLNKCSIKGEFRLLDARIDTVLQVRDTSIDRPGGAAINASRLTVRGLVQIDLPASATGDVTFIGARLGSDFSYSGGPTDAFGLVTLNLTSSEVSGSISIVNAFCRSIFVSRAKVGRDLELKKVIFRGSDRNALIAQGIVVGGCLLLQGLSDVQGYVDLTRSKVGSYEDDQISWPKQGNLLISNFEYGALTKNSPLGRHRTKWLSLQPVFNPQPYQAAHKALTQLGRTVDARLVYLEQRRDERKRGYLTTWERVWSTFLDYTIGYGYQIWKTLLWAGTIVIVGGLLYTSAVKFHLNIFSANSPTGPSISEFKPWLYALDIFLPAVDLYQKKNFRIVPQLAWENIFLWYYWFEILAGWILTTVVIAAVAGLAKRE